MYCMAAPAIAGAFFCVRLRNTACPARVLVTTNNEGAIMFATLFIGLLLIQQTGSPLLIDDFEDSDATSALQTRWSFISDRVMGGVSEGTARIVSVDGRKALLLAGTVSLENNGGFIQAATALSQRSWFDASRNNGVSLTVKGNGGTYFVHIRTTQNRLPWQYFQTSFTATGEWTTILIPFGQFIPENGRQPLDKSRIKRIAVVAAKENMRAELYVDEISLYE